MDNKLAITNENFSFLKGSSDFLNIVLDNITCCVLMLDKDFHLIAFNNALKTIFSHKKNEDLFFVKCGEAIGCAYQVEQQKDCGTTTQCDMCEIRLAALHSLVDNVAVYNENIVRPYFDFNNQKVDKLLQFSTRLFVFNNEKYIILMVEDISYFKEKSMSNL